MIENAGINQESAVLKIFRENPATGTLCEMHWNLLMQNRHMPHKFYLTESGAVLKISGRRATLCGQPKSPAEAEELQTFLQFLNVDRIMALNWHPKNWQVLDKALVMQRPPHVLLPNFAPPKGFDEEVPVDEVLKVLESTNGRMEPEGVREGFWVDFHIRRNHGYSKVGGVWKNRTLVSTAGAYALVGKQAYIACVETVPHWRHQGYASALVSWLCGALPSHNLALLCQGRLQGFYAKFGFEKTPHQALISQP